MNNESLTTTISPQLDLPSGTPHTSPTEPPGPVPAPAPRRRGSFPTRPSSSAVASAKEDRKNVYEIVTSRVLELLDRGTVPWRAGWTSSGIGQPTSAATGKAYRGINRFLLALAAEAAGYSNGSWITFRQSKELGGTIRKGEKGSLCVFWRVLDGKASAGRDEREGDEDPALPGGPVGERGRRRFVLRYYTVFNVQQCDGLPARFNPDTNETPARRLLPCEELVSGYQRAPEIVHGFNSAYYSLGADRVAMPAVSAFRTSEDYYATLFHELTHSTGHPNRLARLSGDAATAPFGSPDYSREELVAEMGSALLCAESGIACATVENQAAYVAGWLKTLKEDARAVVIAAAQAQRAADHILGVLGGEG